MCGRFDLHLPIESLSTIFGVPILHDLHPRFNIAPTQQVLVVRTTEDGTRHFAFLKWGLIPSWSKDPSIGSRMINARSETVDVKPAFRNSLKHRRCIVPANGFYEWESVGGRKKPLYVRMKNNSPMLFAGLWDHWISTEGDLIESCTILTTTSNELIKPLHDRMPVILDIQNVDLWLDPLIFDPEKLKHLFVPCSPEKLEMYPVSDIVNSPRIDIPECISPLSER
ncbi:MAG: SOS response-associated peptidase [Geobacteraceae bacterium]